MIMLSLFQKDHKTIDNLMVNNKILHDISVVIPTYNRSEMLKRAISSVLNQTIRVREIIVVDNNSSDDTPEIISDLYPQIKYFVEKKQGVSHARNLGIKKSKSKLPFSNDSLT